MVLSPAIELPPVALAVVLAVARWRCAAAASRQLPRLKLAQWWY